MKKYLLTWALACIYGIAPIQAQNCTFVSPSVEIVNTQQQANGDCQITFNLSYDIMINNGNKFNFIHLWKAADYPHFNYTAGGNFPPTNATALGNTIVNFGVDNNNAIPVLLSTYGPDNSVVLQSPATNPFITIQKTTSTTANADRFVISNISVTIPSTLCGNSLVFQGDAWSSNSASASAHVQCAMTNFALGIIDPLVSGNCLNSAVPHTYSFNISTVSVSKNVFYSVYLDNGNNLFDPANDQLLTSIPAVTPITITPASGFSSGQLNYPNIITSYTNKIFVAVGEVGQTYLINTVIFPCPSALAVSMSGFNATKSKTGSLLNWTTETEENNKGFEIQRKIDGDFESVSFTASKATAGNSSQVINYSFDDKLNVSGRWVYYRLKQISMDGSYKYSDIKKVFFDKTGKGFSVFPNPAVSNRTNVVLDASFAKADVQIFNASGMPVNSVLNTGNKNIEFNNLHSGFYIIKVTDKASGVTYSEKLVVQ